MIFSLHQGGVYVYSYCMLSKIMQAQLSNIHPLALILHTCPLISVVASFFSVNPNHIIQQHPTKLQVISHQSVRERSERIPERSKNGSVRFNQRHLHPGSTLLPIFFLLSSLWCPRPHSHHPSNLTSVYVIPLLHLHPPSQIMLKMDE